MCDASDFTVGAVLCQQRDKKHHMIYYVSKLLNNEQINYAIMEKKLLVIVYTLEKFYSYIIGSKVIVYRDHAALRYLMLKKDQNHVSFGGY